MVLMDDTRHRTVCILEINFILCVKNLILTFFIHARMGEATLQKKKKKKVCVMLIFKMYKVPYYGIL